MDRNLFSHSDYLTRCADSVAPVARELERQHSLMYELQPISQRAAQEQATMYNLADVYRSVTEFQPASQIAAQQIGIDSITSAASSMSTIAEDLRYSSIADAARSMNTMIDHSRWMADVPALDSWKQVLVRWPRLPEALYTTNLPEVERSIYAAARPEIINSAQQLYEAYDFTSLQVSVRWPEAPHLADFFELDLDRDLDLGAPLADGPVITVPPEAAPARPGKLPDFVSPFDSIDTTVRRRTLSVRRLVVWVAGRPRLVKIVVKGAAGGTGGLVGGIAGWSVGGPAETAMGVGVGGAVSSAVSDSISESIVVFIEKRTRNDDRPSGSCSERE